MREAFKTSLKWPTVVIPLLETHTSLEPFITENKCSRQMANAGDFHLHLPIERWGDVSQLFWMRDFGDIPQ